MVWGARDTSAALARCCAGSTSIGADNFRARIAVLTRLHAVRRLHIGGNELSMHNLVQLLRNDRSI